MLRPTIDARNARDWQPRGPLSAAVPRTADDGAEAGGAGWAGWARGGRRPGRARGRRRLGRLARLGRLTGLCRLLRLRVGCLAGIHVEVAARGQDVDDVVVLV